MPLDKKGGFHLNTQRAMASDKASAPKGPEIKHAGAAVDGGSHTTLHDHGDGTFHTEGHDGSSEEHPHLGHALAHMAGKHGGGAKHMNVHADGMGGHTSHHVDSDGQAQGPHDHENIEALKDHLGKFFDEEANEWKGEDYGKAGGAHESGGY